MASLNDRCKWLMSVDVLAVAASPLTLGSKPPIGKTCFDGQNGLDLVFVGFGRILTCQNLDERLLASSAWYSLETYAAK